MRKIKVSPLKDPANINRNQAVIEWDDDDVHPNRRTFNIETFNKLKRSSQLWDKLKPINEFLETLDHDEGFYLVRMYMQAKRELLNLSDRASAINAIETINGIVAKTFKRLDLSRRIYDYVVADPGIIPPLPPETETRHHHTPEMTFLTPDYNQVNAIIVITKLLFPIFGEVIHAVKFIKDIDNDSKELLAFGTMNTVLSRDFGEITLKLKNYISRLIGNSMSADPMLAFKGITKTSATFDRLAKTLVKSGVNFDLYEADGNFIRYLAVTIRRASKNDTNGQKSSFFSRTPVDATSGDDGRKLSFQENEAHLLKEPIEVPILVKSAIERFIETYLEQNSIDRAVFDRAVKYYSMTLIPPTPINELMVAMFIAHPVGAAYSTKYMTMTTMVKLITIMQMYAVRMGFNELVPIMSLSPTGMKKTEMDAASNQILISEGRGSSNTKNYILQMSEESLHLGDFQQFKLNEYVGTIIDYLVNNIHNYNVSPEIELMGNFGDSSTESGMLRYGGNVVNELFRFLYQMLVGDPDRRILC